MEEDIYLKIPVSYYSVYKTLLIKLSELGEDLIKDCSCNSNTKTKYIINCWNMFQAACAAYYLNETKKAELLINYITKQLKVIEIEYPGDSETEQPSVEATVYYYGIGFAPTTLSELESANKITSFNENISININNPNNKYIWVASKTNKKIYDILANPDTAFEDSIYDAEYISNSNIEEYNIEQYDNGVKMSYPVQIKLR